jgi:hypothetical protein
MRELFRTYMARGHPLQTIVSNGCRRAYSRLKLIRMNNIALCRRMAPDSGETVRLKFQIH